MTVKELKEALAHYKDDAKIQVVITDGTYDSVYSQGLYDMSVKEENEIYDEYFGRERNPQSNVVSITFYR